MVEIAEALWSPQPSGISRLCRQAGVEHAVGGLPVVDTAFSAHEGPWDYLPPLRLGEDHRSGAFELVVIEARPPPIIKAKRGLPGRGDSIETVCRLIKNMGVHPDLVLRVDDRLQLAADVDRCAGTR